MYRAAGILLAFGLVLPIFGQGFNHRDTLAPGGTLRAAFLGDNPVLGRVNRQTGEITGPVADLVKEWARRLNVPYSLIPAAGARDILDRLSAHTADIGFLAYNVGRAKDADFSQPWLLMPNTYIVRADSPIQKTADADRAGVLIAAVKNDTQDVYLSANLKNAHIQPLPKMPSGEEVQKLLTGGAAAFAANKQRLLEIAQRDPSLRVVPGAFFVADQSIAVAKGNAAQLAAVNQFLKEILATNFVRTSLDRADLKGVEAAPGR